MYIHTAIHPPSLCNDRDIAALNLTMFVSECAAAVAEAKVKAADMPVAVAVRICV